MPNMNGAFFGRYFFEILKFQKRPSYSSTVNFGGSTGVALQVYRVGAGKADMINVNFRVCLNINKKNRS